MECVGGYTARQPWKQAYYQAILRGLTASFRGMSERGLPKRVVREFDGFLKCGNPVFGYTQVKCDTCDKSCPVAFSCKGPLCPSCTNRRAWEASFHWDERLPATDFRMWTLSLPRALRLALVKRKRVLPVIQKSLIQAIGCWQRKRLRPYIKSPRLKNGALVFVQLFGSRLQLTPHLHVLVPEALWERDGQRVAVPSPTENDIDGILRRLLRELRRKFKGTDFTEYPEDGYEEAQVEAIQQALPLKLQEIEVPKARKPMVAVIEGFSLHVGRRIHENDREGLRNLIRYAARGPISQSRVSLLPNGKVGYQTKRGQALEFTPEKFVSRLAALIPRKGMHLTVGYGVFASAHSLRDKVMKAPAEETPIGTQEKLPFQEKKKLKPPRINWAELQRRTFLEDVLKCPCGGTRRIVAVVTRRDETVASLKRMWVELPPSDIRETGPPPPPPLPDTQLRLAV